MPNGLTVILDRLDREARAHSVIKGDGVYDHVVKKQKAKQRRCLRCGTKFVSTSFGKRTCGSCAYLNSNAAARASTHA